MILGITAQGFRLAGGAGGGLNLNHNWATLSPFVQDGISPSPFTGGNVAGSYDVSGGRLIPSSYGPSAGTSHGPSAIFSAAEPFGDFQLDFNYGFSDFVNSEAGTLYVGLFSSASPGYSNGIVFRAGDSSSSNSNKVRAVDEGGFARYSASGTTDLTATPVQIKRQGGNLSVRWNGTQVYSGASVLTGQLDTLVIHSLKFTIFDPNTQSVGPISLIGL